MNDLYQVFTRRIVASETAVASLRQPAMLDRLVAIAQGLRDVLARGGTVLTCGNGGSAAEALHLAEELIGRYRAHRPPHRAICLNADPTALTCIANDFGFEKVFSRQCEALLTERDALVVFSTSGHSPNILEAIRIGQTKKAVTIGLLGRDGGPAASICDHAIVVRSDESAHIQEVHQVVLHLMCEALEPDRPT